MSRLARYVFLISVVLGSIAHSQDRDGTIFDIGKRGATLRLPAGWKRSKLPNIPTADQFSRVSGTLFKSQSFLVIQCDDSILDGEVVHRRLLDASMAGMETATVPEVVSDFEYHESEERAWSRREMRAMVGNVAVRVVHTVLTHQGIGFLVISTGPEASAGSTRANADLARDRITFPPTLVGNNADRTPVRQELQIRDHQISLDHDPFLLQRVSRDNAAIVTLQSPAQDFFVFVLTNTATNTLPDALVSSRNAAGTIPFESDDPQPTELSIAGRPALFQTQVQPNTMNLVDVLVVELEPGLYLDVRMVYAGPVGALDRFRTRLRDSIRIDTKKLDRPFVSPLPAACLPPPTAAWRELLEASEPIGALDEEITDIDGPASGGALISTPNEVWRLDAALESLRQIHRGSEIRSRASGEWGGQLFTRFESGFQFIQPEDGPLGIAPNAIVVLDRPQSLVVVSTDSESMGKALPGFRKDHMLPIAVSEFDPRTQKAKAIARFPARAISDASLDAQRRFLRIDFLSSSFTATTAAFEPLSIDLESGDAHPLPRFENGAELAPAEGGWLVTGEPEGGCFGIYRVLVDGSTEPLLLGGRLRGIAIDERYLVYSVPFAIGSPRAAEHIYRIARSKLPSFATTNATISPEQMSEIADTLLQEFGTDSLRAALSDRPTRDRLIARTTEIAHTKFDRVIPSSLDAIDRWIREPRLANRCDDATVELTAILLTEQLLGQGGEWIDATATSSVNDSLLFAVTTDSAGALGIVPLKYVRSQIEQGGGRWLLREEIELHEGCHVLVSTSMQAIRQRMHDLGSIDLLDFVDRRPRDAEAIVKRLLEQSTVLELRELVYAKIASDGDVEALFTIADRMCHELTPSVTIDRYARFVARLAKVERGEEDPALFEEIQADAHANPESTHLALILARCLEQRNTPQDRERARLTYQQCIDLGADDAIFAEAQAGIERCQKQ